MENRPISRPQPRCALLRTECPANLDLQLVNGMGNFLKNLSQRLAMCVGWWFGYWFGQQWNQDKDYCDHSLDVPPIIGSRIRQGACFIAIFSLHSDERLGGSDRLGSLLVDWSKIHVSKLRFSIGFLLWSLKITDVCWHQIFVRTILEVDVAIRQKTPEVDELLNVTVLPLNVDSLHNEYDFML